MSLAPYALCTTEEVWSALDPSEDMKTKFEDRMEGWVNGASLQLEQFLNRPIKARSFDTYQDGNGRRILLTEYYPIIQMQSIEVSTFDLLSTYVINPERSAKEVAIDYKDGTMRILPSATIGRWFHGKENVHLVYEAGFSGYDLEAFKQAIVELIAVYWTEMGKDPRSQQTNESVGNAFFSGRFDPKRLSHQTQMALFAFQRLEV